MSPSRMIGALVKAEMKQDAVSTKAYQRWKAIDSILGIDAERRLGREEAHKRGR